MKQLKWGIFGLTAVVVLAFIFNQSIINHFLPKVFYISPRLNTTYTTSVPANGRLVPRQEQVLSLAKDAVIEEIYIQAGEYVLKGMPLFKVNTDYALAQSNPEEVALKESLAALDASMASADLQEKSLNVDIKGAEAGLLAAQKDYARVEALFKAQVATAIELEGAKVAISNQQMALDRLASQVKVYQLTRAQLSQTKARKLESLSTNEKARLAVAKRYVSPNAQGVIVATADGIMIEAPRLPGEVLAGMPFAKIGIGRDYKDLDLEILVDENDLSHFDVNKEYTFESPTIGDAMGMAGGMTVIVNKKGLISENGMVTMLCSITNGTGQPLLYQKWQGLISRASEPVEMTIPKHCVLTADGNYMPNTFGTAYAVRVKEGVLGKEYFVEALEVRILGVGDGVLAIKPFDETVNSGKLPMIISNFGLNIKPGARVLAVSE